MTSTVTVAVPLLPLAVAVIVAVPFDTAVTVPSEPTPATPAADEVQLNETSAIVAPS